MKRIYLNEPVNTTEDYLYDIAVSLRIVVDMLSTVAEDSNQGVERVREEEITIESVMDEAREGLEQLSIPELKALCKKNKLSNYSTLRKEELVNLLLDETDEVM